MIERLVQQCLGRGQYFFDALGNGLRPAVAKAADLQSRSSVHVSQAVEVIAQTIEQGMLTVKPLHVQFVPAIERDLVEGQHQVLPNACITQ
ncbi:hypothetical protein D3C80_1816330 [compost metagenome]